MRSILGVGLGLFMILMACNKDEETSNCAKLEGKWELTSWTEDDEQFFGDTIYIVSAVLDFKKLDGTQGDVDWMITYTLGGLQDVFGSYAVNASCDEVIITPKSGASSNYNFTIAGDQLTLESHDYNVHVVQVYQRQ